MRRLLTGVLVIATALYPLVVYLWIGKVSPWVIGGILLLLLSARFILIGNSPSTRPLRSALPVMCIFALALMLLNRQELLLWYPVVINLLMLLAFAYTLKFPPPLIERLARISEPDLPEVAVVYTRKVTIAWCFFFALNGMLAALTALWGDLEMWTLYNGLVAYLLMGLMFVIELVMRRRVRNSNEHAH